VSLRVALVHDYFTQLGGAELVVEHLARLFPDAPIYTSVVDPARLPVGLRDREIRTTFAQRLAGQLPLPAIAPLLPAAFARLDLRAFDLVVSSSSGFAHHLRVRPDALHVCYCHTPPRFLWDAAAYHRDQPWRGRALAPGRLALRLVDRAAAGRVGAYVAVSSHIAERIAAVYGRRAPVVHPPVDTSTYRPSTRRSGRFLVVSRLRAYKRLDLAVQAANLAGLPLDVIGHGPGLAELRRLAGPTVRILGHRPDEEVREALASCTGVVVPGVQDFGLTLVEAQASGRPPIAYAAGGALDVVADGVTGFLFDRQEPAALAAAMRRALREPLDPAALVASARRFDAPAFGSSMLRAVEAVLGDVQTVPELEVGGAR
jgi:glycosyltransferase involved in cell wall biosynthesis